MPSTPASISAISAIKSPGLASRGWVALATGLLLVEALLVFAWTHPVQEGRPAQAWAALQALWMMEVGGVTLGTVVMVGFAAQIVDGAMGMAYGLLSTSFLLSIGVPPAVASASVHIAEMGTTGASGLAHWRAGNVNGRLWRRLVLPGAVGALLGAALLSQIDGKALRPFIDGYLLLAALWLLAQALLKHKVPASDASPSHKATGLAASAGGFLDAVGGGGWGPVVTGSLLSRSADARRIIGTVCAAEFVIATVTGVALAFAVGLMHWQIIAALLLGGVIAAPLAARMCGLLPQRALRIAVGLLLLGLSLRSLWKSFAA
ncbi:sulfite exporter TauE/SafE family protein [Paucibacter sp. TC2R-5]|uniref:sulfite exporter TauE/SafE family protein n=1 Tax=Paucibacter sp. TC2R-5 TaxID=2893555 RepID=UPI0021E4BDDB|nr:sulfite exporter TauE/SafE family protein [Paucibacter sp. TC2R-5]MCV2358473.1 sulfite exporter TauE/SafE family protein [Paucibacter sp. TC2R-5]